MTPPRQRITYGKTIWHSITIVLQWVLAIMLASILLFNGAADAASRPALGIGFASIALLVLLVPLKNDRTRPLLRRALLLCLGLGLWSVLQTLPLPLWMPVHPVWQDLSATLGTKYGYFSVNPFATTTALPSLLVPFMVFVTSLMLTQSSALARGFWHKLSYVGVVVVVVSVLRQSFFPDSLVFSGQALRAGQFSGVFINRNVAASAFGLTAFALLGSLALHLAEDRSLQKRRHKTLQDQTFWAYVFIASALFLTAVCLILTRSRAGSLGSLVILLPCLALIAQHGLRERFKPMPLRHWWGLSFIGGLVCLTVFLAAYGEPVLARLEATSDAARWCTWGATIVAIEDNLLFGTGLGTFRDIFPMYRDGTCDSADIVWLRAHNSFLEIYLGLGLPALILVGMVFFSLGHTVLSGLRNRQSLKGIPIAMGGAILFVTAHSFVDFPLQIPGIALYCAALMGAGTSLCLQKGGSGGLSGRRPFRAEGVLR
jgi:O-antigen ligase